MVRDARYDILFEPIRIGPHVAKNRFYQVPHCNGMGVRYPESMAAMRAMKAKGGWAVVSTEETEIHRNSDFRPLNEGSIWTDGDRRAFERMTDAVHAEGALAAVQLSHSGHRDAGLYSREAPFSVTSHPVNAFNYPLQSRQMDKQDIRDYRRWHREAALRAADAGFDIVYVYCRAHSNLNGMFLSRQLNDRSDEYGGALENRVRLLREVLEDTKSAVGDRCAIAVRFTADDARDREGNHDLAESEDTVGLLSHVPDLWDVNVREWRLDSLTSRFGPEGHQEDRIGYVKRLVEVPVVGVGRFTSPDMMASQIRRGVLDLIGAARPSIADPFLPKKVEAGAIDSIRECIGCNICASADETMVPLRCTQNPTMGEEFRKGWHPEIVPDKGASASALVIGSGPAGLECATTLMKRGYDVILCERASEFGGRVARESRLPGLATWKRVLDYRLYLLQQSGSVSLFEQSELSADETLVVGCDHIVIATGSAWRADGLGRTHRTHLPVDNSISILTPDDIMGGGRPDGPVVIFDDDHYYMGSVIAEKLALDGLEVTLVTPESVVSAFSELTLDRSLIETRLLECGVSLIERHACVRGEDGAVHLAHVLDRSRSPRIPCRSFVPVTSRAPRTALFDAIVAMQSRWADHGIRSVSRIGDCVAPSTIAAAVYEGHRWARELDVPAADLIFRTEAS
jgi:dimethylamine/trimethylamine dehydrogenase